MRASRQIRNQRRLPVFSFIALSLLIFTSILSAQDWAFKIKPGGETMTNLRIENKCPHPHLFRIDSQIKYLRFAESTNGILVGALTTRAIGMKFYATGLEPRIYTDQFVVVCIDCKASCNQHNTVKSIQMNVLATPTPTTPTPTTPTPTTPTPTTPTPVTPTPERITPTPTPTPSPTATPLVVSPLIVSPTPTPEADATPRAVANLAENQTPEVLNIDNLKYLAPLPFLIVAVVLGSLGGKRLFDKWKYGENAANNLAALKMAYGVKEQLSHKWLRRRKNQNLHAIGVGKIGGTNNYCIQLFVENANGEMPDNPPIHLLPEKFRKFPIVIYEMPRAEFLSLNGDDYGSRAKEPHETIIGGISGANTNLANEYGTIGYFCAPTILKPIRKFRKEVYLLSNSHVFADLSKTQQDANDLIQQPSPGENKKHNFIACLENYVPIKFDNDTENPNYIDAAIARMMQGKQHELKIPVIGKIDDYLPKEKLAVRQKCRKFGRTTGYTEGEIFSIHLSIWIRYAATGQESFFKEQFLIVPAEGHNDFVKGGDSGSLVADEQRKAIGLIFAGANSSKLGAANLPGIDAESLLAQITTEKIQSFGVANPISEVLKGLNVKLML